MNVENLKARVDALLARAAKQPTGSDAITAATELLQGTITIMHTIYGPNSAQEETLRSVTADRPTAKPLPLPLQMAWVVDAVRGALLNIKAELDGDLLGNLQKRVTGDVLTDFIRLARHVIEEQREGGKDVAAVLVAAAHQDAIRRMGVAHTKLAEGEDLAAVIDALKKAGTLVPPQLSVALGYLNFRNRALHAQWKDIDLTTVKSALAFVEELLLKHFG